MQVKVTSEKMLLEGRIRVQEAQIEFIGNDGRLEQFSRTRILREDAAAVLLFHKERNSFIFTRQFRYPVYESQTEFLLEIAAGKVEQGEDPFETALREAEEETGYRIKAPNMRLLQQFYASPGYTTEKYYLYYAEVTEADRIGKGGGLANENEHIENPELSKQEFFDRVKNKTLNDAKTLMSALCLLSEKHD